MSTHKLSALINYRDQLLTASGQGVRDAVSAARSTVEQACVDPQWDMRPVAECSGIIEQAARDLDTALANLLTTVELQIKQVEREYLIKSYMLYDASNKSPQQVINEQTATYSPAFTAEIRAQVESLSKWNMPGLEIGPGIGTWTQYMVACDPLYIVDVEPEFLTQTQQQFNATYQKRLRIYTTSEYDLSMLPRQQIGLALAVNVFEYLPYEIVKNYLQQVFDTLRPGGSFVFTYNNCNQYGACQLVENDFKCYMTERRLRMIADGIGYIVTKHVDFYPNSTYAVLTRPGEPTSNRGSQMLAKILN